MYKCVCFEFFYQYKGFSSKLNDSIYTSCLIHGSETWMMKVMHEYELMKLNHSEMSMIRWLCAFILKDGAELWELLGFEQVSLVIRTGRLGLDVLSLAMRLTGSNVMWRWRNYTRWMDVMGWCSGGYEKVWSGHEGLREQWTKTVEGTQLVNRCSRGNWACLRVWMSVVPNESAVSWQVAAHL